MTTTNCSEWWREQLLGGAVHPRKCVSGDACQAGPRCIQRIDEGILIAAGMPIPKEETQQLLGPGSRSRVDEQRRIDFQKRAAGERE